MSFLRNKVYYSLFSRSFVVSKKSSTVFLPKPTLRSIRKLSSLRPELINGPGLKDFIAGQPEVVNSTSLHDDTPYIPPGEMFGNGQKGNHVFLLIYLLNYFPS